MKRLITICLFLLLCLTVWTGYSEENNPLKGIWKANRMSANDQDIDLSSAYGDFVSCIVEFKTDTFSITTTIFSDETKEQGNYAITGDGLLAFYVDGVLSKGTYRFDDNVLVLEAVIGGKTVTYYLERTKAEIKNGSIIVFGLYEQDNNTTNGKEPIEWVVLDIQDNKALLISRFGLDAQPYHATYTTSITWDDCTLRTWLNDGFLSAAFTEEEQKAIMFTKVDNTKNQGYSGWPTNEGSSTEDKVFILSYDEALRYFAATTRDKENLKSRVSPTLYAIKRGASSNMNIKTEDGYATGLWWLRSPGMGKDKAAIVYNDGSINSNHVMSPYILVRPTIWVDLNSVIDNPDNTAQAIPISSVLG